MPTAPPSPPSDRPWFQVLSRPATEFPPTSLTILDGEIPPGVRGSLYRVGPGRLQRGNKRVGHWFDGDGAVLAVHFSDEGATGVYRYVQTQGYQKEAKAGQYLYPNYGMTVPGPFWQTWGRDLKNAANTSVLGLGDRLLTLWEGGNPHALDLKTLQTWGKESLEELDPKEPYSAHYKTDPKTGEIYNFGVAPGANATLQLYRSAPSGKILQRGAIPLEGVPVIHDFVMAGQYLVFFVPPVRVNFLPVSLGLSSFGEAIEWKPEKQMQIIVVDRSSLKLISRGVAQPWYQWHFTNAYEEETGEIVVEFVRYRDFATNQFLKEVAHGNTKTSAPSSLWQVRVDPESATVLAEEEVLARECEFPIVEDALIGQPWRYTYLAVHRDGAVPEKELFGAIARFDRHTGELNLADAGTNRYPSEVLAFPDAIDPDRRWAITVVYDGNTDSSEVWIYPGELDRDPVCRLGLPSAIPHSFHGTWRPEEIS